MILRAENLKLLRQIMRLMEREHHVYTPAEMAAYERMKRFAETGVRVALPQ